MAEGDLSDKVKSLEEKIPGIGKKLANAFVSNFEVTDILKKIQEVDIAAVGVVKSFGQGRELILSLKQGMTDAVVEVTKLGGGFADIAKIQLNVSNELGRNVVLNSEAFKDLYAATEVTGREANTIVAAFKNIGVSTYNASQGIQSIIDVSRQLGVNAQAVTEKVLNNIDSLNKYTFQGGVDGLARMAAQATSLRIDMNQTLNFAEKVFNPEGAIQAAAALQRLGVAQSDLLDPLRLMDLAQNDPTELQNQIVQMTEQFVQLNEKGQFEIMPGAKRQLREISSAMGIPYEQLTKMAIGSADLSKKMQEITFPNVPEDQKQLIANMAEMGKSGQYEVTFTDKKGEKQVKAVSELTDEDIKLLGEASQPKTLEDLAKEQLDVNKSIDAGIKSIASRTGYALAGAKTTEQGIQAGTGLAQGAAEILSGEKLSTKNIREGIDPVISGILKDVKNLISGDGSIKEVFTNLSISGEKFKNFYSEANEEISERIKETTSKLSNAQNSWIEILEAGVKRLQTTLGGGEQKPKDFAYLPGVGKFEAFPEDTFLGFTDNNKQVQNFIQQIKSPQPTQTQPLTFTEPNEVTTNTKTENKIDVSGTIEIKVTAPSGIDITQLQLALNDNSVKQQIISSISKIQNNELTSQVV